MPGLAIVRVTRDGARWTRWKARGPGPRSGGDPWSNPATYTGVWDHVRKLFAATTEAKVRGYQFPAGSPSTSKAAAAKRAPGELAGTIKHRDAVPARRVRVPCEVCHGARYNTDTLAVHYKGKNIADVLDMPIEEAAWPSSPRSRPSTATWRPSPTSACGYVRLGQPAPTLSGGEAQRVKLASELHAPLHRQDHLRPGRAHHRAALRRHPQTARRPGPARRRRQHRHRHRAQPRRHQDRRPRSSTFGPDGGSRGGHIIATGTPEHVATLETSHTGQYLRPLLAGQGGTARPGTRDTPAAA